MTSTHHPTWDFLQLICLFLIPILIALVGLRAESTRWERAVRKIDRREVKQPPVFKFLRSDNTQHNTTVPYKIYTHECVFQTLYFDTIMRSRLQAHFIFCFIFPLHPILMPGLRAC